MLTVTQQIWTANLLLLLHAVVVGVTVGGFVAMLTGRFARFHPRDYFAWAFIVCCGGQILSLLLTGGCVFTQWERALRQQADPQATFAHTFLQEYLPFLPGWLVNAVPIIALGGLCGASIQIYPALRRKRQEREKSIH